MGDRGYGVGDWSGRGGTVFTEVARLSRNAAPPFSDSYRLLPNL